MENVEKFLIDLEVLYHMRRAMPGCVVMGGLAVPFHLDREAARVSIDVDVVTGLDAEGSRLAMDRAFKDMGGTIRDGKPHRPRFPRRALPLNTYFCRYTSALDTEPREIKIGLLYARRPGESPHRPAFRIRTILSRFFAIDLAALLPTPRAAKTSPSICGLFATGSPPYLPHASPIFLTASLGMPSKSGTGDSL